MTNDLNARVDKMARWAAEVEIKLRTLSKGLRDYHQKTIDPVAAEITQIWNDYDNLPIQIQEKKFTLIELDMVATEYKDNVAAIEDEVALNVSMQINDTGKPLYSNENARKAATRGELKENEAYGEAINQLRGAERLVRQCKAEIERLESQVSEFGRRNRALVARIEYATAVISGGQ